VMYGDNGTLVELHWAFVPPHFSVFLDLSHCWPRRDVVLFGNRTVPSLNAEDLLLMLALHGAKHCWSHLSLITDLAWLLATEQLDWPALLTRAGGLGIGRMVLLGASLAFRIFEVPLADPVAAAIERDPAVAVLTSEIAGSLFGDRHDEGSIRDNASMHMRMRERLGDRLRYFFKLTFRPGLEDWQALDLPAALSFLYPVLRFPRLALKYRSRVP
jgi:hypothetical protein